MFSSDVIVVKLIERVDHLIQVSKDLQIKDGKDIFVHDFPPSDLGIKLISQPFINRFGIIAKSRNVRLVYDRPNRTIKLHIDLTYLRQSLYDQAGVFHYPQSLKSS